MDSAGSDLDNAINRPLHSAYKAAHAKEVSKEERLHFQSSLLDAMGQALIATDPLAKIIYWNRAAENLYGWSAKEVMGRSIIELTPSEELIERAQEIMAEESGLIIPIGEQLLEEACRQAKEWQEEHPRIPPLVMSVNLSARQLRRPDLATTVEEVLQRTGFEATCLGLDITETVYIKALEGNTAALDELKRLGVKIAIDDFGMGYSSLSYSSGCLQTS